MRIAIITGVFPVLSESFVRAEIEMLLKDGHEVHVYCASIGDDPRAYGSMSAETIRNISRTWGAEELAPLKRLLYALRSIPAFLRTAPRSLTAALNVRRAGRDAVSLRLLVRASAFLPPVPYDVIHAHFGTMGVFAQSLRDIGVLSGPLVTTFHGHDISSLLRERGAQYYQRLFASGDLFLPVSDAWGLRLKEIGCPPQRIRVHRLGVDLSQFADLALGRTDGPVRILSLSRLVEKKGIEFGIRAIARLAAEGLRVRYDIVGDGPLVPALTQLAASLGVASSVHFLGAKPHSEVAALLHGADVLLYPSVTAHNGDQEGIPVTIMEAMAAGLPVVSTWHTGIPELVEHEASGLLTRERDVEGLADALRRLVVDEKLRRRMGTEGKAIIAKRHDSVKQSRELMEIFSAILPAVHS